MKQYLVKIGELEIKIEATNHRMAVMKAIEKESPKTLGILCSALKIGDSLDNEMFFKTEFIFECMGFKIKQ